MVVLPIENGTLRLDDIGLHIAHRYLRKGVTVSWSNIQFINIVPSVRRIETGWKTFSGEDISPESLRAGLRFYSLEPVLKDRHTLLNSGGFLRKMVLRSVLLIKPLYRSDDEPDPMRGVMRLSLSGREIRKSPMALLDTLDAIQHFSEFGLLTTED